MVMYMGQNRRNQFYPLNEIGRDDGQSEVESTHYTEKAVCSRCDAEYTDQSSIDMVKKWLAKDNYAPCPNLSCCGQMAIIKETING